VKAEGSAFTFFGAGKDRGELAGLSASAESGGGARRTE